MRGLVLRVAFPRCFSMSTLRIISALQRERYRSWISQQLVAAGSICYRSGKAWPVPPPTIGEACDM